MSGINVGAIRNAAVEIFEQSSRIGTITSHVRAGAFTDGVVTAASAEAPRLTANRLLTVLNDLPDGSLANLTELRHAAVDTIDALQHVNVRFQNFFVAQRVKTTGRDEAVEAARRLVNLSIK